MKKKNKIILIVVVALVCILAVAIALLYTDYQKNAVQKEPEINYDKLYEDEKDVKEEVEDIKSGKSKFSFTQVKNEETLQKKFSWIENCAKEVEAASVKMSEMEKFAQRKLEKWFPTHTEMFPKKHKIDNNKYLAYDFKIQNKAGMGEEVYLLVTDKDFYDELPQAPVTKIGKVKAKIFYTHNRRKEIVNQKTVNQYMYEVVFKRKGMTYYLQMNYSGFDYNINMIETTKEATSNEVVMLLTKLIG